MSPRRPDDRDRQPPKSPPLGVPSFVAEEGTGVHEGDELARIRSRRSTADRLSRLERKHDALDKTVTETRVLVGRMDEKLDGIVKARHEAHEFWRKFALKVGGGALLLGLGALLRWWLG